MNRMLVAIAACLMAAHPLYAESAPRIAQVDLNRVQNELGYQRLFMANVHPDVKAEIIKLKQSLDTLLLEVVREEDESKATLLQARVNSINNKLNTISSAMGNRGVDHRKAASKLVAERFGSTYPLIIDSQMMRGHQLIVWNSKDVVDITDEVIRTLDSELP